MNTRTQKPLTTDRFPSRFIRAKELAAFLGIHVHSVRRFHVEGALNAPPRTQALTYDTWNPAFQKWLDNYLGWEGAGAASVAQRDAEKSEPACLKTGTLATMTAQA